MLPIPSFLSRFAHYPVAPAGLPMGPGWLPMVGHVPQLMSDLPGFLRACEKAGPLCWFDTGRGALQLLSTREEAFVLFRNRETSSKNMGEDGGAILGRSILVLDGSPHRRARGAMAAPFTPRGLNASRAGSLIREVVEPRIAEWTQHTEVALTEETREFAVDVIFRMMGIPSKELAAWRHQFEELILIAMPLEIDLPGTPRRRGLEARRWIDERLEGFIADARNRSADADLVAAMVHGRDEHGQGLEHEELLDNLRILVFAGHETTASVMAWMTLELATHPHYWHRAVEEALAGDGPPTTAEELAKFPFMESVFRETLRLHPPLPIDSRRAEVEFELFGIKIPAGTTVGCSFWSISRNPERYPEPARFNPDRWAKLVHKPGALETAQFGGGPHFCLGYHMAWMEAVQYGVTLARALGAKKLAPILADRDLPKPIWFPASRPPVGTRIRIGPAPRSKTLS